MRVILANSGISRKIQGLTTLLVVLILLAASASLMASEDGLIITPCDQCATEQDFAMAARQAAPEPPPGDAQYRIYSVYVVNFVDIEVRFFSVAVWREEGEILPMMGTFQSGVSKVVYPGDGDPEMINDITDAVEIATDIHAYYSDGIFSTEFDSSIGSAVRLVGPSGEASYNRGTLINELNDHYNSILFLLRSGASDIALRLVNNFVGSSDFRTAVANKLIKFEDGTSIRVEIKGFIFGISPTDGVLIDMEVRQDTARLP